MDPSVAACEICGWLAAIGSMLAFGSFGVPIKSDASRSVDVDPLVFQSYKSIMVLITSWLVLFAVPFRFTPWGVVSGLFWVPGGVATVLAVKWAGLAVSIGVGSSFIVFVSFVWGIFVFREPVHSKVMASIAIGLMMTGLIGMAYFSSPVIMDHQQELAQFPPHGEEQNGTIMMTPSHQHATEGETERHPNEGISTEPMRPAARRGSANSRKRHKMEVYQKVENQEHLEMSTQPCDNEEPYSDNPLQISSRQPTSSDGGIDGLNSTADSHITEDGLFRQEDVVHALPHRRVETIHMCGYTLTRRQIGIMAAIFNGTWGGSIMAPMRWCHDDTSGVHYLMSFSIGASLVTVALWVIRYLYHVAMCRGSLTQAYQKLPSFHLRVMWLSGGSSGLLWSIGNFFSLLSVFWLGEGVGYSVIQAAMLVSGLWGIFYFKEITDCNVIAKWFASACITVSGILLLSYEHHKK